MAFIDVLGTYIKLQFRVNHTDKQDQCEYRPQHFSVSEAYCLSKINYFRRLNIESMAEDLSISAGTKQEQYESLIPQIKGLLTGEAFERIFRAFAHLLQ